MTRRARTEAEQLARSFLVHSGVFLVATGCTMVMALAGDAWWWPMLIFWGIGLAVHGLYAWWLKRRERWVMEFDPKDLSEDQKAELEWNRRHGTFWPG